MKRILNNPWSLICIILAIPFAINFLGCIHAPFSSWEEPNEWTKFWGQYISGFAAFAMLYVAWKTFHLSKEANRPYIIVDLIEYKSRAYLRCRNVGHNVALNIKLHIDNSLVDGIEIEEVKSSLLEINNQKEFILEPNGKKIYELFCIPSFWLDSMSSYQFSREIKYSYRGKNIDKKEWEKNEAYFASHPFTCKVTYNEHQEEFLLDYNNRVGDIDPLIQISDQIFAVNWSLSAIKLEIEKIAKLK